MARKPEPCVSPLEEVLESIPAEQPPEELRERCLATVKRLSVEQPRRTVPLGRMVWQSATAGALITLVALMAMPVFSRARAKAQVSPPPGREYMAMPEFEKSGPVTETPPSNEPGSAGGTRPGAPGGPPPGGPGAPRVVGNGLEVGQRASLSRLPSGAADSLTAPAAADKPAALGLPAAPPLPEEARGRVQGMKRAMPLPPTRPGDDMTATEVPPPADYFYSGKPEGGPERPWYDSSDERQRIVHTTLELAVKSVEEAQERAQSIVEKADGWVEDMDMQLGDKGKKYARFTARVPVERLSGVLAELGDLGEQVTVHSESDDATREYRAQGAQIRQHGASEDELVAQYEAAQDRQTRQRLYAQIQGLRAANRDAKQQLRGLSEETHYAYLQVTLTEKLTPLAFLGEAGKTAGGAVAWVAVTAIIWLPLLALLLMLYRRTTVAPPEREE